MFDPVLKRLADQHGLAFVGLFPGNMLGPIIVERALWNTRVTLGQMSILEFGLLVPLNAAVWAFLGSVVRFVRGRRTRSQA